MVGVALMVLVMRSTTALRVRMIGWNSAFAIVGVVRQRSESPREAARKNYACARSGPQVVENTFR